MSDVSLYNVSHSYTFSSFAKSSSVVNFDQNVQVKVRLFLDGISYTAGGFPQNLGCLMFLMFCLYC